MMVTSPQGRATATIDDVTLTSLISCERVSLDIFDKAPTLMGVCRTLLFSAFPANASFLAVGTISTFRRAELEGRAILKCLGPDDSLLSEMLVQFGFGNGSVNSEFVLLTQIKVMKPGIHKLVLEMDGKELGRSPVNIGKVVAVPMQQAVH